MIDQTTDDVTVIDIGESMSTLVLQVPDSSVSIVGLPGSEPSEGGGSVNPIVDWFSGTGPPPSALIGAGPGDMYIDVESGTLYQLR